MSPDQDIHEWMITEAGADQPADHPLAQLAAYLGEQAPAGGLDQVEDVLEAGRAAVVRVRHVKLPGPGRRRVVRAEQPHLVPVGAVGASARRSRSCPASSATTRSRSAKSAARNCRARCSHAG